MSLNPEKRLKKAAKRNTGESSERLQSFRKELEDTRKEMEEKEKELTQCERELAIKIQDLLRQLEEKKAEFQRLCAEREKAELELHERLVSEAEDELQYKLLTDSISRILDRVGGPGSSSKIKDPLEQLEAIRHFHRFFSAADESDKVKPSTSGQKPVKK